MSDKTNAIMPGAVEKIIDSLSAAGLEQTLRPMQIEEVIAGKDFRTAAIRLDLYIVR